MARSSKSRGPPVRPGACRAVNGFRSRNLAARVLVAAATSCRSSRATRCGSRKWALPDAAVATDGSERREMNMCTTCGCGDGETRVDGVIIANPGDQQHEHRPADGTVQTHWHRHEGGHLHAPAGAVHAHRHADGIWHSHVHDGATVHGPEATDALGGVHDAGMPSERIVRIEQDILARNNAFADENRRAFADRGNFALNLVSSHGSGKTTLLVRTIDALQGRITVCVIEGDQQTSLDADRIRATGAAAVQVNTGKGCHLDAQ